MRLVYKEPFIDLNFEDEAPWILAVENQFLFTQMIGDLWRQSSGGDGGFRLSEKDKEIRLDKQMDFIANPFAVSCNDKKIINKIYSEICNIANDQYLTEINRINADVVNILDILFDKIPYPLRYSLNLEVSGLLKLYDVKVDNEDSGFLEHLVSYMKLMHQVCQYRLFVFLNLKQYISTKQSALLYEMCRYEHIYLLDFEGYDIKERLFDEKYAIIDKDFCFINVQ